MSPHSQDENFFLISEDLVNDPMMEIDSAGETSRQLAARGFVSWRSLEGVRSEDFQQGLRLFLEVALRKLRGVFAGLLGIYNLIHVLTIRVGPLLCPSRPHGLV